MPLGPRPVDQHALLLLDRQLAFLRLIDRQRGAGFQVAVRPAAAAAGRQGSVSAKRAALLIGIGHFHPAHV